jgi:hypothetical protein
VEKRRGSIFPIKLIPIIDSARSWRQHFLDFSSRYSYSEFTLLIRGRHLEAFCLAEQLNGAGTGKP